MAIAAIAAFATCAAGIPARGADDFEKEPIRYSATAPDDAVARLEARLRAGEVRLAGDGRAVVEAVLRALDVPAESQVLVFSKTSFQASAISPTRPRALYFSDSVYVGWVPRGLIEIAAIDRRLGPVFYSLDPLAEPAPGKPRFVRDDACLDCHGGQFVREIPAVFARSVHADRSGKPILRLGTEIVDGRTPFEKRWGGWYVTGRHGSATHRGNVFVEEGKDGPSFDFSRGANITSLAPFLDTSPYLAGTSDIVALLVLEHQLGVQNAIIRAGHQCRRMMHYQANLQREMGEAPTDVPTYESVRRVVDGAARDVVDALLGKDEAPLPAGGVRGDGAFERSFASRARRDPAGASLRDLDMETRLFRYRCSYLIDDEPFAALPPPLLERIYALLAKALRPAGPDPRYSHLDPAERARIISILRATHRGLPEGWLGE